MSERLSRAFRRNVRERMDELGLTQTGLAKKLRVTPSFVSQMLGGHRNPGLESLEDFAKALDVEAADLIREKILSKAS